MQNPNQARRGGQQKQRPTPKSRVSAEFAYTLRLIEAERDGVADLLDVALGDEYGEADVADLWDTIRVVYAATLSLPPCNRGRDGAEVFWRQISRYLSEQGWTNEQLERLKNPLPSPAEGRSQNIFDGWED